MTPSLRIAGLAFAYPDGYQALFGVNLEIAKGERVALLGPNGAGKSSLMQMIATLSKPSSGRILLDGSGRFRVSASLRARASGIITR